MITIVGGGKSVTMDELEKIQVVTPPNAGRRWWPVRHDTLIKAIKAEVVARRGWHISDIKIATTRSGGDMAGAIMFSNIKGLPPMTGMQFALGFVNSNTRRKALKLTVGTQILCCLNGMCTGTILMKEVHEDTLMLETQIELALDKYEENARSIPAMVEGLQAQYLSRTEAAGLCMLAADKRLIGYTAAGRVFKEFEKPTFKEHGKDTSWTLLNAFTYAGRKNITPVAQMETFDTFRRMLPVAPIQEEGGVN